MDSGLARSATKLSLSERPRNDERLFPLHDPAHVSIELHAAERAALVELPYRVGLQLGLLGKGMLAKILRAAGRAIAEVVGAVVVPPAALVIRRAVQNLEMDVGMVEPDPAELHQVFRLQPDREPAMVQRFVAEIADPQARHADAVLVGIERADRLAKRLADAVAAVRAHRHVGADAVMPRI